MILAIVPTNVLLAAEQSTEPVLEQLDPSRRVAVVMALLGITLIGLFFVLSIMMGGHWVRRLARHRPGAARGRQPASDNQRLRSPLPPLPTDPKTNDTVLLDMPSQDTKAEG